MAEYKNKINCEAILNSMKQNLYLPVYCFHGEEIYYIDLLSKYIENHAIKETERSFNQIVLYGKEIDYKVVLDNVRRFPIMAERQLVVIREAQELKTIDQLSRYLENPLDSTILVLVYKNKKIDERKRYVKAMRKAEKAGRACIFQSDRLYESKISGWISNYLKNKKYTIVSSARDLLAEYLGNDLSKIANELDKLTINLPAGSRINNKMIQGNIGISKDFNVFELQRALGRKDAVKANRIINHLTANSESGLMPAVTTVLYNFFSKLYICKFLPNLNSKTVMQALKVKAFFTRDYTTAATNYSRRDVECVLHLLRVYDLRSKGVWMKLRTNQFNEQTRPGELLKEMIYQILNRVECK